MNEQQGPPGLVAPALRRWWRLVLALTAGLGLALTLALDTLEPTSYEMSRTYLVSSLATAEGGDRSLVSANTDRAARDYAAVLRRDEQLLTVLGARTGRTPEEIRSRTTSQYQRLTSAIALTYEGGSAAEVQAFFDELDRVVASDGVATSGLPAGSVRPLQSSRAVVTRVDPIRTRPASAVFGALLLGLALAVAVERTRPRVLGRAHLQGVTRRPVLSVGTDGSGLEALAVRLRTAQPSRVAVLVADGSLHVPAADLADELRLRLTPECDGAAVPVGPATEEDLRALELGTAPDDIAWLVLTEAGRPVRTLEARLAAVATRPHVVVVLLGDTARALVASPA